MIKRHNNLATTNRIITMIKQANNTNAHTNTYKHGCTLSQEASSKNSLSQNGRDWPSHTKINQRRHRINIQPIHIHVENEACTHIVAQTTPTVLRHSFAQLAVNKRARACTGICGSQCTQLHAQPVVCACNRACQSCPTRRTTTCKANI